MEIQSFAKVNLYLEITGTRPDGYHELISLMCGIDLADTLRLEFETARTTVTCTHPDVPEDSSNLALRAARLFADAVNRPARIAISIEKKIPPGAGLGGGSSNAAAVLKALNRHYGHPLSPDALMNMALEVGADVPFFIDGGPAIATGIGERLMPWPYLASSPLVVIYPGLPLSTAEIYQRFNFGLTKNKKIPKKDTFRHLRNDHPAMRLYNDLEAPAIELLPEIAEMKHTLMANGATGALMTGSGSAVFGLYPDGKIAGHAYSEIARVSQKWQIFLSRLRCG